MSHQPRSNQRSASNIQDCSTFPSPPSSTHLWPLVRRHRHQTLIDVPMRILSSRRCTSPPPTNMENFIRLLQYGPSYVFAPFFFCSLLVFSVHYCGPRNHYSCSCPYRRCWPAIIGNEEKSSRNGTDCCVSIIASATTRQPPRRPYFYTDLSNTDVWTYVYE